MSTYGFVAVVDNFVFDSDAVVGTREDDALFNGDTTGVSPAQRYDDFVCTVGQLIAIGLRSVDAVMGWQVFRTGQAAFLDEGAFGIGAQQFNSRCTASCAGRVSEQRDALERATLGRDFDFEKVTACGNGSGGEGFIRRSFIRHR